MEVVQFSLKEQRLEHVRRPKPKVSNADDVVIKIFFCGICRRDLYIIDGTLPCQSDQPILLGHEICGVVTEVGTDVRTFKKGDKVVVDPNSGCGVCDLCRSGTPQFCKASGVTNAIGVYKNGGWAQYVLVPEHQVFKIPQSVSIEKAVLAEPLACVSHGLDLVSPIKVGERILIVGTGLLGNLWAAMLHFQGHRRVTVSEPNLARLEYIKKLEAGFDCTVPKILKERQMENPTYLFDLVIDCSDSAEALELDFKLLDFGGKLVIFGMKPPKVKISVSPFEIYQKEITVIGANVSGFNFPKALTLLEYLGEKYLDFDSLGIKTYTLKDYENAINHVKKKSVVKAIFSNTIQCSCSSRKLNRH
ncbi:hypothetical protein ILUMI_06776 [Ignelater luminosus]|uniref:Enoyl reductase (ER) domain-containing protein n=1 Tax=Ignelater luminosus TaxID=2038154 RepID=A0A8K0GHF6_IGNLU|nr:hypothetical protein ILUMI_06776 [Ignelater luminosus]